MQDYLILIHKNNDPSGPVYNAEDWAAFLGELETKGILRGGSSLGEALQLASTIALPMTRELTGYLKIATSSVEEAQAVCKNIPDFKTGATIEICPLIPD